MLRTFWLCLIGLWAFSSIEAPPLHVIVTHTPDAAHLIDSLQTQLNVISQHDADIPPNTPYLHIRLSAETLEFVPQNLPPSKRSPILNPHLSLTLPTRYLTANPTYLQALIAALTAYTSGDYATALTRFEALYATASDAPHHPALLIAIANSALFADALEIARSTYQQVPPEAFATFASWQGNFAWLLLQYGDTDAAFALLEMPITVALDTASNTLAESPEITAEHAEIALIQAQLHALNFDLDNALIAAQSAVTVAPNLPQAYLQRGRVYVLLYEWDLAMQDFTKALDLDANYADAYYARGMLYYTTLVQRQDALADFEQYLTLAPTGFYAVHVARYHADIQAELDALNAPLTTSTD